VSFVWNIALQQLRSRRRQTLTVVSGVVVGVTVLLVTISLFGGLLDSFTRKILDVAPHVTMKAESVRGSRADVIVEGTGGGAAAVELEKNTEREERTRIRNVMTTLRIVERDLGDRIRAASPYLSTQVLAAYGTNQATLPINGVIPSREAAINDLPKYLRSGSIARLEATHDGILIGEKIAADLGVDAGDRLQLVSLTGDVFQVQVVGVYRLGVEAADRSAFVNLRLAQAIDKSLPSDATGIGFQLRDVTEAPEVARQIERLTGHAAETWQETNAGVIAIFLFLRALFLIVVGFVIIISGFGIANILITTVLEKRRDIAVMKSFGVSARAITRIYLLQGIIIALVGSVVGSVLGGIAIKLAGMIPSGETAGVAPIETKTLQMEWNLWYFAIAIAGTLVVSIIASVAPARTAAHVPPVEVLRGER
jgi:lipoprotein-releasing system permease protein